jgi:acyl-coenzyme A synthetase/AMP-(fatty) acid ligase
MSSTFCRFQVSPTELEEIIGQHSDVADAAVTSVWDDSEATEIPRAFVVPKRNVFGDDRNILSKDIQEMVTSKVAGYKKLRGGVYFIDSLPRNPTGKLLRRELRKMAQRDARI